MKVEVAWQGIIKPARPTAVARRRADLSLLEQLQQPHFAPFIYFYDHGHSESGRVKLKRSLGETLTLFYPLAGRVKENLFVDCNDEGVPFFEARVEDTLSATLRRCSLTGDFDHLFPPLDMEDAGDLLMAVQVNFFSCGGMAIGAYFSHKMADALSMTMFMKYWAAVARGNCDGNNINLPPPQFGTFNKYFPPNPGLKRSGPGGVGNTQEKIVTKRFVVSVSGIAALKARYATSEIANPSQLMALSAFLWSRFAIVTANDSKETPTNIYLVIQAVNLRARIDPSLDESHFGNSSRYSMTFISAESRMVGDDDSRRLVREMRESIEKVDKDYVDELCKRHLKSVEESKSEIGMEKEITIPITFSSLVRFPLYETDFGWGKPVWATLGAMRMRNSTVVFLPTASNDGVEAVIHTSEAKMKKLQEDKEFLAFASTLSYKGINSLL